MKSPLSLDLGIINIVPFVEVLIFIRTRIRSLGMRMGRC